LTRFNYKWHEGQWWRQAIIDERQYTDLATLARDRLEGIITSKDCEAAAWWVTKPIEQGFHIGTRVNSKSEMEKQNGN